MHITSNSKSLLSEGRPNERKDEENSSKLTVLTVQWLCVFLSVVALPVFYQIHLEIHPNISPNRVNWTNKTRKYFVQPHDMQIFTQERQK